MLFFPMKGEKRKSNTSGSAKKKRKGLPKQEENVQFQQELLQLQARQIEIMQDSDKRQEQLILKLEEQQRKADVEARKNEQEFLLRLAQLFASK